MEALRKHLKQILRGSRRGGLPLRPTSDSWVTIGSMVQELQIRKQQAQRAFVLCSVGTLFILYATIPPLQRYAESTVDGLLSGSSSSLSTWLESSNLITPFYLAFACLIQTLLFPLSESLIVSAAEGLGTWGLYWVALGELAASSLIFLGVRAWLAPLPSRRPHDLVKIQLLGSCSVASAGWISGFPLGPLAFCLGFSPMSFRVFFVSLALGKGLSVSIHSIEPLGWALLTLVGVIALPGLGRAARLRIRPVNSGSAREKPTKVRRIRKSRSARRRTVVWRRLGRMARGRGR